MNEEKMSIDEEIANCEKLAEINRKEYEVFKRDNLNPKSCILRAEKYEQLAEWLKELRRFKVKEARLQKNKTKQMLDELSKMSPMVVATAYVQATNYTAYGEDVTEKWTTAIQNSAALEKAYNKGYYDALQRLEESEAETEDKNEF